MKWLVWIAAIFFGLVVLAVGTFAWLGHNAQAATDAQRAEIAAALKPVEDGLARGEDPDAAALAKLAADPWTRASLYELLVDKHKESVFPKDQLSRAALAESALVVWLAHPHELAARPDEIELAKEVVAATEDGTKATYLVFRFRTKAPHWAADIGWMAGITGPYRDETALLAPAEGGVFSTLEPFAARTPEAHVESAQAEMRSGAVTKTQTK